MIYLVTKQTELFDNEVYKLCSIERSIDMIYNFTNHIVQVDTETTGLIRFLLHKI